MLLTGKNWRLSASQKVEDADTLLNVLLKNRGITEGQSVEQFLSEDDGIWHDPFLYNDMQKAVDIINDTIDRHGKVLVYGDYDCDGVTATSILVRYFRSHQVNVQYIVPHRSEHGYGLTEKIMDKVIEKKPDLVITVDCGVTNIDTVQELKNRGIQVIVTDHHNVKDELPPADCVICAKRPDNTYPFIDLCGAHSVKASAETTDETLLRAIGFKKQDGGEYFCDMDGMFDGKHCSGHAVDLDALK